MRKRENIDLLNGRPGQSLALLTLPVIGSSFIQMLYNFTDLFWISSLGANTLAAVGTGGTFLWLTEGVMLFARMGGQVLAGQAYGRRDSEKLKRITGATIQLGVFLAALVTVFYLVFHKSLIGIFHFQSQETITAAETYLVWASLGIPFQFLTRIFSGLLAALGNTRTTFIATVIGLVCNMLLDPLFILVLGYGAGGAAVATALSQLLVFLLILWGIKDSPYFRALELGKRGAWSDYREILHLGVPAGLQTILYAGITLLLSRLVTQFGDLQVAAQKVCGQIESLTWTIADAFAVSINAFVAQNLAAGKKHRVRAGYRASFFMTGAVGAIGMVLMIFFPDFLAGLFFRNSFEIEAASAYLIIVGFSEIFMCTEIMTSGAFAGLGNTWFPSTVIGIVTAMRIPLSQALIPSYGVRGVWMAISVTSMAKGLILFVAFQIYLKKKLGKT